MKDNTCIKSRTKKYEYVKSMAEKINQYLNDGYLVFDQDKNLQTIKFEINENEKIISLRASNDLISWNYLFFDFEDGSAFEISLSSYKKTFSEYRIVHPKCVKKLK